MSPVQVIAERLRNHPQLTWRAEGSSITVDAPTPDGFSVGFSGQPGQWTVWFDGWHEEFTSEAEAINCFTFGLSDECRLKVFRRGRYEYRWTVETRSGDDWCEDSSTTRLFFPFWKRCSVVYRQNSILHRGQSE